MIGLFSLFIYGFASIVIASTSSLTSIERLLLIYFLVFFPVIVIGVFAWIIQKHSEKQCSPIAYKNGEEYIWKKMVAVASLSAATAKRDAKTSEGNIEKIVDAVQQASPPLFFNGETWRNRILWVDDHPENNTYERQAFEALGIHIVLALSTEEALHILSMSRFAAVISDMGRHEGPREGYVLLDQIRKRGDQTPLFFYASSNAPEHKRETYEHGGQGCTNEPKELFAMVTRSLLLKLSM